MLVKAVLFLSFFCLSLAWQPGLVEHGAMDELRGEERSPYPSSLHRLLLPTLLRPRQPIYHPWFHYLDRLRKWGNKVAGSGRAVVGVEETGGVFESKRWGFRMPPMSVLKLGERAGRTEEESGALAVDRRSDGVARPMEVPADVLAVIQRRVLGESRDIHLSRCKGARRVQSSELMVFCSAVAISEVVSRARNGGDGRA